ncbi:MAG TPA: signal peptide peptidase SppA, partial [Cyanobacteria bacterium UBA11049]|nr:signal peptide peptidase SppA [Cyanobacteria bacterium UBA11049]
YTLEERKPLLARLFSGDSQVGSGLSSKLDWVEFELSTSGLPLWLYRP